MDAISGRAGPRQLGRRASEDQRNFRLSLAVIRGLHGSAMGEHDRNFKLLLRTFFREFLAVFAPELSRAVGARRIEFCDKELLRQPGKTGCGRVADLVARVRLRGETGCILVHVEHQSRREKWIGLRLLIYAAMLMEQTGLPVYPILITSYDRPITVEPEAFAVDLLGRRILAFHYRVVQLNRLDWRQYLKAKTPPRRP